ncbi:MAG: MazG nucleotide pyrophosphohydrolase domain-containing protein [Gordonia sp. (in: high G+C Gram-positive bacteria)]
MTVVLLDPLRPDMIPVGAAQHLTGHVVVTEDVHPSLLWHLKQYTLAGAHDDSDVRSTILTSDLSHPLVRQRVSRGDVVIRVERLPGETLIEAVDLMDRLRKTGPWERTQTHDSLRRYLLEEAYELLDAIDHGSQEDLLSELGDLLLQVLFHARIAEDSAIAPFGIDEVAASFVEKVTHRTPGVLSGEHQNLERQIEEWEAAKAAERGQLGGSVLDGVVTAQPALSLTQKLFERLAGVDFPVEFVSPVLYQVKVPFRQHSRDSVEDDQRRRAVALMDQVRAAEKAAAADGVVLREENLWRKYLGMSYDEAAVPAVEASPSLVERAQRVDATPPTLQKPGRRRKPDPEPESSNEVTSPIPPVIDAPQAAGIQLSPDPLGLDRKRSKHSEPTPPASTPAELVEASGDAELRTPAEPVEASGESDPVADDTPLPDPSETKLFAVVPPKAPEESADEEQSKTPEPAEEPADAAEPPAEKPKKSKKQKKHKPDTTMTVHQAGPPVEPDFPDVDDFPGPPPAKIHVNDDPILAAERAITVTYSDFVPGMIITESWSAKDDDK